MAKRIKPKPNPPNLSKPTFPSIPEQLTTHTPTAARPQQADAEPQDPQQSDRPVPRTDADPHDSMSSTPTAETVYLPAILLLALVREPLASIPELSVRSHDSRGYRAMIGFLRSGVAGRAVGLGYLAHVVDVVVEGGWLGSLEPCVY